MREARISRTTAETAITARVALDGTGAHEIATGVGFFDHMLAQLSRHSLIDIDLSAGGSTDESEWQSDSSTSGYTLGDVVERKDS